MPPQLTPLDEVDAIYADDALTPAQKAQNAAAVKAIGWRSAFLGVGVLPQTWGFNLDGFAWSVTLDAFTVTDGTIRIDGSVTKDGVLLTRNEDGSKLWPIYVTNPPLLTEKNGGGITRNGKTYVMDIVALGRSILASVFAGAVE